MLTCMRSLSLKSCWLHQHDLTLQFLVVALQSILLSECLLNGSNELPLKLMLLIQVLDLVHSICIVILLHIISILVTGALVALAYALHFRSSLRLVVNLW